MRTKAIKDLSCLSDDRLFEAVSAGLGLVAENATRIAKSMRLLAEQKEVRGARVLESIAKEEAAKYLILLDAIRCPRKPSIRLSGHLAKFNDHLAKGIYADSCSWQSATLGELRGYVDCDRESAYLDGPNDVDFIFPNRITRRREEALYVDYVQSSEEGNSWLSPMRCDDVTSAWFYERPPAAVELVAALHTGGCATSGALRVIAEIWRSVDLKDTTHVSEIYELNLHTLRAMETQGLLFDQSGDANMRIVNGWKFPMHSVEMGRITVDESNLREIQNNGCLDW